MESSQTIRLEEVCARILSPWQSIRVITGSIAPLSISASVTRLAVTALCDPLCNDCTSYTAWTDLRMTSMITSRPHSWHDNWRIPLPPPTMPPPPMNTRPMLACADGSFLPLIAKYHASPHAHVFQVDTALCPDLQLVTRKQCSPSLYHVGPASPIESSVHAPVDPTYKTHEHVRPGDLGSSMDLQV